MDCVVIRIEVLFVYAVGSTLSGSILRNESLHVRLAHCSHMASDKPLVIHHPSFRAYGWSIWCLPFQGS